MAALFELGSGSEQSSGWSSLSHESPIALIKSSSPYGNVFLPSKGNGLEHGTGKIYERLGCFGAHEPLRDSREKATKGGVEI